MKRMNEVACYIACYGDDLFCCVPHYEHRYLYGVSPLLPVLQAHRQLNEILRMQLKGKMSWPKQSQ